jgi:hypothetical protein
MCADATLFILLRFKPLILLNSIMEATALPSECPSNYYIYNIYISFLITYQDTVLNQIGMVTFNTHFSQYLFIV